MKYYILLLIILCTCVGGLFYTFKIVNELKKEVQDYGSLDVTRLQLLDTQISKMNVLILDLETFLKKTKPIIE